MPRLPSVPAIGRQSPPSGPTVRRVQAGTFQAGVGVAPGAADDTEGGRAVGGNGRLGGEWANVEEARQGGGGKHAGGRRTEPST